MTHQVVFIVKVSPFLPHIPTVLEPGPEYVTPQSRLLFLHPLTPQLLLLSIVASLTFVGFATKPLSGISVSTTLISKPTKTNFLGFFSVLMREILL